MRIGVADIRFAESAMLLFDMLSWDLVAQHVHYSKQGASCRTLALVQSGCTMMYLVSV